MQFLGMIAGLLNKLGKIGVIIGFCLGTAVLTYFANGNTVPVITIREILIASLGLLIIPKSVKIDIEDIIGKTKYLPTTGGTLNGQTEETVQKLNTVSETISEMAKTYNQVSEETEEDNKIEEETKESFKDELLNNIDDFSDNILYDDLIENDNILNDIYDLMETKEEIEKDELLAILEKNNNYIIGLNEEDEQSEQIEEDIKNIVKAINQTYRINKLNLVWKQKEAENRKVLASQLGGVSKVISSLANDIIEEKDDEENIEDIKPKYKIKITTLSNTKNNNDVCGDTFMHTKLHDGKFMMAISDGMGSRRKCKEK
jgi:stage II sporulation protein E